MLWKHINCVDVEYGCQIQFYLELSRWYMFADNNGQNLLQVSRGRISDWEGNYDKFFGVPKKKWIKIKTSMGQKWIRRMNMEAARCHASIFLRCPKCLGEQGGPWGWLLKPCKRLDREIKETSDQTRHNSTLAPWIWRNWMRVISFWKALEQMLLAV